jgi:hypothetical protein
LRSWFSYSENLSSPSRLTGDSHRISSIAEIEAAYLAMPDGQLANPSYSRRGSSKSNKPTACPHIQKAWLAFSWDFCVQPLLTPHFEIRFGIQIPAREPPCGILPNEFNYLPPSRWIEVHTECQITNWAPLPLPPSISPHSPPSPAATASTPFPPQIQAPEDMWSDVSPPAT